MEGVLQQDCGGTADVWPISSASVKNGTPQFLCWKQHFTVNREAAVRSKILTKQFHRDWGGYKEKSGELSLKLFQFIFSFMRMLMAIYMLAMHACSSNFSSTRIFLKGKGLTLVLV
jgi:hypothetical protein